MELIRLLKEIKWKYLFTRSYCRVCETGNFFVGKNVSIKKSKIYVYPGSELIIGDSVNIENCVISINKGGLYIKSNSILGIPNVSSLINIEEGKLNIGPFSYVKTNRIWIRFGGICSIGKYTNINRGSEIRCDSSITIGDYNQISYNVNIWDTNTHNILSKNTRRELSEKYFPYLGFEKEKPITAPIIIGNDCWIGQNSTIFKGSIIKDEAILGFGSLITGQTIPEKSTAVNDLSLKIWQRNA